MVFETLVKNLKKKEIELSGKRLELFESRASLELLEFSAKDHETARSIAQEIAKQVQQDAHQKIATIVSKCLSLVFNEPYEFSIQFETKRGKTDATILLKRGSVSVDPISASGGGVVDVAAFALRLACLSLARPKLRHLMVLDEPFKFVSVEYRERIREMLEFLSQEFDFQFVMVTHFSDLETGKILNLRQK